MQLTREYEQLQVSLETSNSEKEAFSQEADAARKSSEVYEKHVLELTNQITVVVREKEAADESLRKLQREAVVKEKEAEQLKERVGLMQKDATGQSEWVNEREVSG